MTKAAKAAILLYAQAESLAEKDVEFCARAILRQHPNLEEFGMGMGGWFFTRKIGETIHGNSIDLTIPKYLEGLQHLIDEYDEYFKITGWNVKFTATGPKGSW
jgi:hypothetical protein